jgi:alpha-methylacyl-CoA racemase
VLTDGAPRHNLKRSSKGDFVGRTGPLTGVRVIELAGIGPGPTAAMLLADMGAEVLRVDRPSAMSSSSSGTAGPALQAYADSARFDVPGRGRRSTVIDLRHPQASEVVLTLVETADILLEGNRPGVTERLGIGPDACLARNPRLVYGRMTGWGQHGPWAPTAGHDIGYIALTGALHAIGDADRPVIPLNLIGDFGGGSTYLVIGLLAALLEARTSGQGQVVDAAITDGASSLMSFLYGLKAGGAWVDQRASNPLDGGLPWYSVYQTSDGKHIAVGALEPQFYQALIDGLGVSAEEGERSAERIPYLRERFAAIFASRTRDEWEAVFTGTDACVAPVLSMEEAPAHPHNLARKTFIEIDGVVQPAPAPRFSRTPGSVASPPVKPGSHTVEALADWGVTDVKRLLDAGVVAQAADEG